MKHIDLFDDQYYLLLTILEEELDRISQLQDMSNQQAILREVRRVQVSHLIARLQSARGYPQPGFTPKDREEK